MNGPMLNFIIFCTLLEITSAITFISFNSNTVGASSLNSNANIFGGGAAGGFSQSPFGGFGFGNPFFPFGLGFFPFGLGFGRK
ncbi:putative integral membrane protein [Acanthocheilonema viteae]